MPKILRILNRFNLGGPVLNASYLSADLSPEFETLLVGGREEPGELNALDIPRSLGLEPMIIESMRRPISPTNDWKALRELRQLIRSFQPDIVHTHASKAGALGRIAAFQEQVPVVIHTFHGHVFHSYFNSLKTTVYKHLERYFASRSSAIVTISERQRFELVEELGIIPPEKAQVIPLGFDLAPFSQDVTNRRQKFRNAFGLHDADIALGIVGRLAPVKNHRLFIDVIAELRRQGNERVVGIIIGDGEMRQEITRYAHLNRLVTNENDGARDIIFTSWIYPMSEVISGLDIVCLTSLNEGTPVSLIEAQAAAIPVISTDVGGIQDVIKNGVSGAIIGDGDYSSMAQLIHTWSEDASLRASLGSAGKAFVNSRYSRERLASDMKALYHSLL